MILVSQGELVTSIYKYQALGGGVCGSVTFLFVPWGKDGEKSEDEARILGP